MVAHEVLKDDADIAAENVEIIFAQIDAIEQDTALIGIIETGKQLDERRLAGAVLADEGQHFTSLKREA